MEKSPADQRAVVKYRLTAGVAQRRVRELAKDTGNVVWTDHIKERMDERGLDSDAVLRILRGGDVEEEPTEADKPGDWKIKMVRRMATGRFAGVATVLTQDNRLVLTTAEWEDRR
jgi:hypothetical protein